GAGAGVKQSGDAAAGGSLAGIVEPSGVDCLAASVLGAGETFLDGCGLGGTQTGIVLGGFTDERFGIEVAAAGVEEHPILDAVFVVAGFQDGIDDELLVGGG